MFRIALVPIFLLGSVALNFSLHPAQGNSKSEESDQLELRLSASRSSMLIGGAPISLSVGLWNKGTTDFFAASSFVANTSAPAYVIIQVEDGRGETYPLEEMDAIMSSEAMNDSWTRISPWHFYGIQFPLDPANYDAIRLPGKYKLTAEYVSRGGVTAPSPDWSVPSHKVWKGKLESNPVWIEVLPSR